MPSIVKDILGGLTFLSIAFITMLLYIVIPFITLKILLLPLFSDKHNYADWQFYLYYFATIIPIYILDFIYQSRSAQIATFSRKIKLKTAEFEFSQPEQHHINGCFGEDLANYIIENCQKKPSNNFIFNEPFTEDWGFGFFATHRNSKERYFIAVQFCKMGKDYAEYNISIELHYNIIKILTKKMPSKHNLDILHKEIRAVIQTIKKAAK